MHNSRGIALISVILIISILVVITLQFNRFTRSKLYETANLSDSLRLHYTAKSGFNLGQALLLADNNNFDALTEDWGRQDEITAKSSKLFPNSSFKILIEDEQGKININKLVVGSAYNQEIKEMLTRLLSQPEFDLHPEAVAEIIDSIKDWLDADDETTGAGAERSHYLSLDAPYTPKNSAPGCIEELLMIKGVTADVYYGTTQTPGLSRLLTVYGDGRININTAPTLVLRALAAGITPSMIEEMDEYRKNKDNNLADLLWYKKIAGMSGININQALITVTSDYFRITAVGIFSNMQETVSGVIKRDVPSKKTNLIYWKSD